jgi:hypothetical protein
MEKRFCGKIIKISLYVFLVVTFVLDVSCKSKQFVNNNKYPYLNEILETYFYANFSYPENMNQLIDFLKKEGFLSSFEKELFQFTIEKIEEDIENYSIILTENDIQIYHKEYLFYEEPKQDACILFKNNWIYSYQRFIFVDSLGNNIRNYDYLSEELMINENIIGKNFENFKYFEDSTIVYQIIRFERNSEITDFCNPENHLLTSRYFQEIQVYLEIFAEKHNLLKIIHAVPVKY